VRLVHPKHWSGVFSAISVWLRVTGSSVNRRAPCTRDAWAAGEGVACHRRVIQSKLNRRPGNIGAVPYSCALRNAARAGCLAAIAADLDPVQLQEAVVEDACALTGG